MTTEYTLREMRNIPDLEDQAVRISGPRFKATVTALDEARCEAAKLRLLLQVVMDEANRSAWKVAQRQREACVTAYRTHHPVYRPVLDVLLTTPLVVKEKP